MVNTYIDRNKKKRDIETLLSMNDIELEYVDGY